MAEASKQLFRGVGVALLSLFDTEQRLLVTDTARLAAQIAGEGARAIVLAGSTGEAWALTADERKRLIEAARELVPNEVTLIVGTGQPDERAAAALTAGMRDTGADAVLALSPAGVSDPTGYYEAVAEAAGGLPVLAYHFPKVSSPGVPVDALDRLPIAALKDSSGDAERLVAEIEALNGNVYTGNPLLLAAAGAFGAAGAILGLANLDVAKCARAFAGDLQAQADLVAAHTSASRDFPAALKQMVSQRRGTPTGVRTQAADAAASPAGR